mmetsp:Transcript_5856/g.10040  ORF Transcript_5856/g.10040 Transcript_5856/m.10040 type:complete len:366 (+) Transcript_5856:58-1155(+)
MSTEGVQEDHAELQVQDLEVRLQSCSQGSLARQLSYIYSQISFLSRDMLSVKADVDELKSKRVQHVTADVIAKDSIEHVTMERYLADSANSKCEIQSLANIVDRMIDHQVEIKSRFASLTSRDVLQEKLPIFGDSARTVASFDPSLTDRLSSETTELESTSGLGVGLDVVNSPLTSASLVPSLTDSVKLETIEIDSTSGLGLGLEVKGHNGQTLIINRIHTWGIVHGWNQANRCQALQSGDQIIQVNDARGDSVKLIEQLKIGEEKREILRVTVRRHEHLQIDRKSAIPLGLEADGKDGKTLIIERIHTGGLADEWNKSCRGRSLTCGDQIIQVNNVSGDSGRMWLELHKDELLRLTIRKGETEL